MPPSQPTVYMASHLVLVAANDPGSTSPWCPAGSERLAPDSAVSGPRVQRPAHHSPAGLAEVPVFMSSKTRLTYMYSRSECMHTWVCVSMSPWVWDAYTHLGMSVCGENLSRCVCKWVYAQVGHRPYGIRKPRVGWAGQGQERAHTGIPTHRAQNWEGTGWVPRLHWDGRPPPWMPHLGLTIAK